MGKINFSFNGNAYSVDESVLSRLRAKLLTQFEVLQAKKPKITFTVETGYTEDYLNTVVSEYQVDVGMTWRQAAEANLLKNLSIRDDIGDYLGVEVLAGVPGIATPIGAVYDLERACFVIPDDIIESKHYKG